MNDQSTPDADRIVTDPEILVGKPVVRGTRIPVELVLEYLATHDGFGARGGRSPVPARPGPVAAPWSQARTSGKARAGRPGAVPLPRHRGRGGRGAGLPRRRGGDLALAGRRRPVQRLRDAGAAARPRRRPRAARRPHGPRRVRRDADRRPSACRELQETFSAGARRLTLSNWSVVRSRI